MATSEDAKQAPATTAHGIAENRLGTSPEPSRQQILESEPKRSDSSVRCLAAHCTPTQKRLKRQGSADFRLAMSYWPLGSAFGICRLPNSFSCRPGLRRPSWEPPPTAALGRGPWAVGQGPGQRPAVGQGPSAGQVLGRGLDLAQGPEAHSAEVEMARLRRPLRRSSRRYVARFRCVAIRSKSLGDMAGDCEEREGA